MEDARYEVFISTISFNPFFLQLFLRKSQVWILSGGKKKKMEERAVSRDKGADVTAAGIVPVEI